MERINYRLVKAKRKNITQVPEQFKQKVLELLKADGLDGYGNPLKED